ncbi:MAG: orotate phosphoribosyltransferase [Muribaculaceae bacterium]|nr:orotate phosphoribosyltransferase [Muribaculaceae bacterium]MDE6559245.1 orotate phosphoribosyltransferase [Muribaculaceae bacterium]
MKKPHKLLAEKLLHISAIKLQPESPFVWASGWNSPIYTDNRVALSYPDVRNFIKVELARHIMEEFPEADAIAGVATGAIAIGAIVADVMGLPYVYVRSTPKDHGLENMIEGNLRPGSKVVVIEDLVSTATSSLKAVEAIEMSGCDAIGMTCIFNFEFPEAVKRISDANLSLVSLLTYSEMLEVASEIDYITPAELDTLRQWREDPSAWTPETSY